MVRLTLLHFASRLCSIAEAKERRDLEDLADRFEEINEATRAELRALRNELARMHAIEDIIAAERDEARWLQWPCGETMSSLLKERQRQLQWKLERDKALRMLTREQRIRIRDRNPRTRIERWLDAQGRRQGAQTA